MSIRCKLFGHDFNTQYTQPEERFERLWEKWLGEPIWREIFDHKCKRCNQMWRFWRWTREAARKTIEEDIIAE